MVVLVIIAISSTTQFKDSDRFSELQLSLLGRTGRSRGARARAPAPPVANVAWEVRAVQGLSGAL